MDPTRVSKIPNLFHSLKGLFGNRFISMDMFSSLRPVTGCNPSYWPSV